ncbi:insulin-like growth factor-binding protein 1 [Dasypus novemcinctus]|uniref:insulin-like growth factor-binding protein 1 n=1 Tax=Dasypus novemcinctus TaxID=9361 RepID=UPI000328FA78|nr:insulin-like growth factor-binding protein 1 [Dasypus novemcinctus]
MPQPLAARAWPLLLLLGALLAPPAGASQPLRCVPCSADKVAQCPPVPSSCPEVALPPACSCCPTCALQAGAACGVKTERCARGLSCRALPGDPRPLLALTRGQGTCVPAADVDGTVPTTEATDVRGTTGSENVLSESKELTQEELLEKFPMMGSSSEELPVLWKAISVYERMKGSRTSSMGPCQKKLYKVLEKLSLARQNEEDIHKFYLPNCNRNGFYHIKQCESSLDGEAGFCWCVYPWNGKKMPWIPKVRGDPKCHEHFSLQN